MSILVLLGRICFSVIFIMSAFSHFTQSTIQYAASQGVPYPWLLVPLSGILSLLGGISILLGFKAKWGAWAIILFLIPVTLTMHHFWDVSNANAAQQQQIQFFKNLAMLGGALLITYFGSGPWSMTK